jgi:hypothetical protein
VPECLHFYSICTAEYVPRVVVLHGSLNRVCTQFSLHVYMDDAAKHVLDRLDLPGVATVAASALEASDPALANVKATRTSVEYCWTAKASAALYLLKSEPGIQLLTYVDADLEFFHDPSPLYDELGDSSVLLQPHRFPPGKIDTEIDGAYNAGFVAFRADGESERILGWWRERCLDWCYNRREPGRFADQKYLEEWPDLAAGVHALRHPGAGLAV